MRRLILGLLPFVVMGLLAQKPSITTTREPKHAAGKTTRLKAGDNLQAIINAAQPGDTIVLEAGRVFSGNYTLPAKSGSGWVTITSSAAARLPENVRVRPSDVASMAAIDSPNTMPAIKALSGAHHYRLIGIASKPPSVYSFGLWVLGEGMETLESDVPHHIEVDRCYIVGDPVKGGKRGILLNAFDSSVKNSYIADLKSDYQDTQAVSGWNMQDVLIENNYLEAAGENVFVGEYSRIPGFYPSSITIRRNHLNKPLAWQTGEDHSPVLKPDGSFKKWAVKNLLELKGGKKVTITGNVMTNCWTSAQTGFAVVFKPGEAARTNPSRTEDVLFENNLVENATGAVNILATHSTPAGLGICTRVTIRNNAFVRMALGRMVQFVGRPANGITIENNTFQCENIQFAMMMSKALESGQHDLTVRNNIWTSYGKYGVRVDGGSSGTAALEAAYPNSFVFEGNLFRHEQDLSKIYPPTTRFVRSLSFAADGYTQIDHREVGVDSAKLSAAIAGVVR